MRETYKDYKRKYNELLKQQKALEARIINKAREMVQRTPDVPIKYMDKKYTVRGLLNYLITLEENEYQLQEKPVVEYLHIIKTIENYNEKLLNYKQLKMF